MAWVTDGGGRAAGWFPILTLVTFLRRRWVLNALRVVIAVAFLLVTLRPVFNVPLINDDFYLYADWARQRLESSWWQRLNLGSLFSAGRVLPVGTGLTPVWVDSIFQVSNIVGVAPDLVWRSWRLIGIVSGVAFAAAFATTWGLARVRGMAWREWRPGTRLRWLDDYTMWFLGIALLVGSFIQLHSVWDNDPVSAYIYPAWGTCALYFVFLALLRPALTSSKALASWSIAVGAIVGVIGVWFYELFLPALVIAAVPIVIAALRAGVLRRGMEVARLGVAFLGFVVIPGVAFLIPRLSGGGAVSGDPGYTGTSVAISGRSVTAFKNGVINILPGGNWRRASDQVGGVDAGSTLSVSLVVGLILLIAAAAWLIRQRVDGDERLAPAPGDGWWARTTGVSVWWLVGILVTLGIAAGTIGIQSVSARWQESIASTLGNVHTFYPSAFVAAMTVIAVAVIALVRMRSPWPAFVVMTLIAAGAGQQFAVNTKLTDLTKVWVAPNVAMQAAFVSDPATGDAERCAAITQWDKFPWPLYYKWGIGYGLTSAWKAEHGTVFCSTQPEAFNRPYYGD